MILFPVDFTFSIRSGVLIPVLLMLPNLFWMFLPKTTGGETAPKVKEPLALTIVENVGRAAVFILPVFFALDFKKNYSFAVSGGMFLALLVYYACWIRYFRRGRQAQLLKAPFLGIPLPMALAPILFLLLSAFLMGSWLIFIAALLFGVAHIWVSAISL